MENFFKDLNNIGIPTEELALKWIKENIDDKAYRIVGKDKEKDIVAPTINKWFEVKDCNRAIKNVPIKLKSHGAQDSGLSTTKSDYWVFYVQNKFMIIKTEKLKEIIEDIQERQYADEDGDYLLKLLPIYRLELASDWIVE